MVHFLFYAGRAYNYKQEKLEAQKEVREKEGSVSLQTIGKSKMNPVGESLQDGYLQEASMLPLLLIQHIAMRICQVISLVQSLEQMYLTLIANYPLENNC